jgi:hypothetical protein
MPFRQIPGSGVEYGLVSFDARGRERQDDPDGVMSERLVARLASGGVSNIFVFVHGWMGDIDSAQAQFDAWIAALDSLATDRDRATTIFPSFAPLYVGVHWPSLAWGNESLTTAQAFSTGASDEEPDAAPILEWFDDDPRIRAAVSAILDHSQKAGTTPEARDALATLNRELRPEESDDALAIDVVGGDRDASDFGGGISGGVLDTLRLLSYWSMKKRARAIGEGAIHNLLRALQAATAVRRTPIHLTGHSFGSVVVSAALRGPHPDSSFDRPIDSVALLQGAVSLWSYAATIPDDEKAGCFCDVVTNRRVRGPIITTRSRHDLAVHSPYRLASRVSADASFGAGEVYPRYGAIGRFGLQGLPDDLVVDTPLRAVSDAYRFACGRIYNLEASTFICNAAGAGGAHNDVAGPEVAHAIWEAAFASVQE